ncbi:LysR family transcriptional regulator [Massilia sp. KIM]|uniref:LysR family transcriptional regulator n=1 Tax=Massilia sp. KIM TaxID=1955422 RepID=UPI00098ED409|nr:LysR family transcriptional regulator [Massilia sp. KIM]OON64203.1 LysR family transcriptional regulator [Massilia sp. KIM]
MNLADLRVFVCVARHDSLHAAAQELHLTPSAVSKSLRRLEEDVGLPLFDRSARQLVLNDSGKQLLPQARTLLELAEKARIDLQGERAGLDCRIGGPAVLLWRHADAMAQALLPYPSARLHLKAVFEGDALAALARGELDAALVTDEALDGALHPGQWEVTDLGELALAVIAGRAHPLAAAVGKRRALRVSVREVLAHPFASPARSLFCGQERGSRSDGWRDGPLPRIIRYWTDDLQVLLDFVRSGAALAYLPAFAAQEPALLALEVRDLGFSSVERVRLVWKRDTAPQWLRALAHALSTAD